MVIERSRDPLGVDEHAGARKQNYTWEVQRTYVIWWNADCGAAASVSRGGHDLSSDQAAYFSVLAEEYSISATRKRSADSPVRVGGM